MEESIARAESEIRVETPQQPAEAEDKPEWVQKLLSSNAFTVSADESEESKFSAGADYPVFMKSARTFTP